MSFYMITYGMSQIEELYIGRTELETVNNARSFINEWPENRDTSDEEIIELAKADRMEFDLVEIHAPWPEKFNFEELVELYENQFFPHC